MRQFIHYLSIIIILLLTVNTFAQETPSAVNWYTLEEAEELAKKDPKPLFIDVYTDWCGWCKRMDKGTFSHPQIASYLNAKFYAVKFNAETRDTIDFQGKTYINKGVGSRPTHDLAIELLDGRLSYPTTIFMDKEFQKSVVPGYLDVPTIEPVLVYFSEELNKSTPFDQYEKYFNITFRMGGRDTTWEKADEVRWYGIEEALELQKKQPKKILINFYADWVMGSKMMMTTFRHPKIASYINENYYAVNFDVTSRDTLNVFGNTFVNQGPHPAYHTLVSAMLENNMKFPALICLNEEAKLVDRIQNYLTPVQIEPVLKFFGEDAYKTKKWNEYRAAFQSEL